MKSRGRIRRPDTDIPDPDEISGIVKDRLSHPLLLA
jgi:hypothetical protein